jgi:enoyl-CoA hydratase/carnithine racemase
VLKNALSFERFAKHGTKKWPTGILTLSVCEESGRMTGSHLKNMLGCLKESADSKCIVLTGSKNAFCLGMDLQGLADNCDEFSGKIVRETLRTYAEVLDKLRDERRPIICLVEGQVVAGGVGFPAVSDIVIAHEFAEFSLPEAFLGLVPGIVMKHLAAKVGVHKSRYLSFGLKGWSSTQAQNYGLVDVVTSRPFEDCISILKKLNAIDVESLAAVKSLANATFEADYEDRAVEKFGALFQRGHFRDKLWLFEDSVSE